MAVREQDLRVGNPTGENFGRWLQYIPGLLALLTVGYAGKIAAKYVPHIEYVLFAIAFGMIISNTVGVPKLLEPGIATYEFWLKAGIVLMGARLALQDVFALGLSGVGLVIVEIVISIAAARFFGRLFGLSEKLRDLIGIGVGICGVSAIMGAMGAIDSNEEESTYAIATILIFGAAMVFIYPLLANFLGLSDQFFGYWAGLSIDNTAEAVATGFAFSEAAGNYATTVKMIRNALMGVVILLFALSYARKGLTAEVENKGRFLWVRFPKFLIGFLLFSVLATLGFFSKENITAIKNLSSWAFLMAFAGVGFRARFAEMRAGIKPFLVGLGVETAVSMATFLMLLLAGPYIF